MFIAMTFITIIFSSCKRDNLENCTEHLVTTCSEDTTKTNLRIKNISKYDFCNVVVMTASGDANYGIIKEGETTCYIAFDTVYSYSYIQLYIGNKDCKYMIYDYVGEEPLGVGKFTYLIDLPEYRSGELSITVQED